MSLVFLGFPCAIRFYSISGKFDQILLKIALNTNNKYILKLIIKNYPLRKCTAMATYAVSFSVMMRQMCIILLMANTTKTLENSFLFYQFDSCCGMQQDKF